MGSFKIGASNVGSLNFEDSCGQLATNCASAANIVSGRVMSCDLGSIKTGIPVPKNVISKENYRCVSQSFSHVFESLPSPVHSAILRVYSQIFVSRSQAMSESLSSILYPWHGCRYKVARFQWAWAPNHERFGPIFLFASLVPGKRSTKWWPKFCKTDFTRTGLCFQ